MKLPDNTGSIAALVGSLVSVVVVFVGAFNWFHFSQDQTTVIVPAAIFFAGLGVQVYAVLRSWQSQTYNQGMVTSILTTAGGYILSLLSAFGVFHATAAQQSAVTAVAGVLGTMGLLLFGILHTKKTVVAQKLAGLRP